MADGALGGLLEILRERRGWTQEKLAEVAGVAQERIEKVVEAPSKIRSGDTTLKALSTALEVDAWLLERAASTPRENLGEVVRVADRFSGGRLGALWSIAEAVTPGDLEQALRQAQNSISPDRQIELARLISLYTKLDQTDRELLIVLAARFADQDR